LLGPTTKERITMSRTTTPLKRRVTAALREYGLEREVDFHYSDEGDYPFSPSVRGKMDYDTLALYARVDGDAQSQRVRVEEQAKVYDLATKLLHSGFKVEVQQNHAGDPGCVLVAVRDN
jgi:hypothetical protein